MSLPSMYQSQHQSHTSPMSTKWARLRLLVPAGIVVGGLAFTLVFGVLMLTPVLRSSAAPAATGYIGDTVSDPKGSSVVVDVVDAGGTLLYDDDGVPVRVSVNAYTFRPGDDITVYQGTGDADSKYGTDSTYLSTWVIGLWFTVCVGAVLYGLIRNKHIAHQLDRYEDLVRRDERTPAYHDSPSW